MKAVVVHPGTKDSVRLDEVQKKNEVLLQTLRLSIDGTDGDINDGFYGTLSKRRLPDA